MQKLGFGCMRFPLSNEEKNIIDTDLLTTMVDKFMENGFNYFDTAHVYHKGQSEEILKKVLVDRYPRKAYIIADKLPIFNLEKEEDMQKIFDEQLNRLSIDYFDYYMLHNVSTKHEEKFTKIDSFSFIKEKKKEGKIRHIGISCHDTPEFLEDILQKHPEIEFVQLQINYLDWQDDTIQSKRCYDIATKYDKKVIVMEPLKGGSLINIPQKAKELFKNYNNQQSIASWAMRFVAGLENVMIVLSGMQTPQALTDNINTLSKFEKITPDEEGIIEEAVNIFKKEKIIPCTGCNYCIDSCPQKIPIPKYLQVYNTQKLLNQNHSSMYYRNISSRYPKSSQCISCKNCILHCPQSIDIPKYMEKITKEFE